MIFTNAQLVLPDRVVKGSLEVRNGKIRKISSGKLGSTGPAIDLKGNFLAPGFIDLHIHGAVGRDTMEASETAFREITEYHLRGGTTSLTLTTLTASHADIIKVLKLVSGLKDRSLGGSRIVGVHVEGPYIARSKMGAQDPLHIRDPQKSEWQQLLKYSDVISEMTLAPELPGALPLITALRKNGIIASGGHTEAGEPDLRKALGAGLNHATHTFNAMSTIVKRGPYRTPGMIEFALAEDDICCELIADGQHVPPTMMKMLFNAKGADRVCLITDATSGAGLKSGTTFALGSVQARVTRDTAEMADGTGLAGSTLTMIRAVKNAVQLAGQTLPDAIKAATLTPAKQLRRDHELGSLTPGKRADLVAFNQNFEISSVWLDGDLRYHS